MRRENPFGVRLAVTLVVAMAMTLGAAAPLIAADAGARGGRATPDAPLDLNSASADALATVPGIGKVMAKRIVAWREEHGPFRRVEDLLKVKGVGDKTFDKLRPYLKVGKSR